jgi:hypothetical protein
MEEQDLTSGMMNAYWIQAFPALVSSELNCVHEWLLISRL